MQTYTSAIGAMALLLVAAWSHPNLAAAHGAVSGEDDPCLRRVGEKVVHFNAYQPQHQLREQYCTDIPQAGDTFLVVDLVDPAWRTEPIGMRIVKGFSGIDGEIVAEIRPSPHPDGVLRGEVSLEEGVYTVTIATENQNLMKRPQYLLRVHMTDYQQLAQTVVVPLLGLLLATWLGYKLIRSKWLRNWWTVLRS